MKIDQLLNKYDLGERNFQSICLREVDLTEVNLPKINFESADKAKSFRKK